MSELEAMSPEERLDAELSALLDGELGTAEATALRARMASAPELAARFAALGEVDSRIRASAAEAPAGDQLERMRAGLQERLDGEPSGRVIPLRRSARYAAPIAAAVAAALALYLSAGGSPDRDENASRPERAATPPIAHRPSDATDTHRPRPEESAQPGSQLEQIVRVTPDADVTAPTGEPADGSIGASRLADAGGVQESVTVDGGALEDPSAASEEEVAIAIEYEMLADLDVIENLDLLERLQLLGVTESM